MFKYLQNTIASLTFKQPFVHRASLTTSLRFNGPLDGQVIPGPTSTSSDDCAWKLAILNGRKGWLVGGFNQWNWIISPSRDENKKYLKPPPRELRISDMQYKKNS